VGAKDALFGEEVIAWVIAEKEGLEVEGLLQKCSEQIAHYKVPRWVVKCEEFPLTVSGKVKKNVIRDWSDKLVSEQDPSLILFAPHKNRSKD
jgi:fatty-acyl-CoA synthase